MKKLFEIKEFLETIFDCHSPPEDGQYLLQRPLKKVDSNISTPRLYSIYG